MTTLRQGKEGLELLDGHNRRPGAMQLRQLNQVLRPLFHRQIVSPRMLPGEEAGWFHGLPLPFFFADVCTTGFSALSTGVRSIPNFFVNWGNSS